MVFQYAVVNWAWSSTHHHARSLNNCRSLTVGNGKVRIQGECFQIHRQEIFGRNRRGSYGYDISDYESESAYRFLADSSNIETIEDNRIYIKYPKQVFSDGTAVFGYYILEYGTDEINMYYGKSLFSEAEFLYHATKKMEDAGSEATADELLDAFINGKISAVDSTDSTSTFYITDLNTDSEEWGAYSVGEKVDLDNDGENELIISGPYGELLTPIMWRPE